MEFSDNGRGFCVCAPAYTYLVPQTEAIISGQILVWENRALGNSLQPNPVFPIPTLNRPDSLETLVFVSLITSSDSALWLSGWHIPFPSRDHSPLLHCEKVMARNLIWSQCQLWV